MAGRLRNIRRAARTVARKAASALRMGSAGLLGRKLIKNSKNLNTLASRGQLHVSSVPGKNGEYGILINLTTGNLAFDLKADGKVVLNKEKCTTTLDESARIELSPYKRLSDHPIADYFHREIEMAIKARKK